LSVRLAAVFDGAALGYFLLLAGGQRQLQSFIRSSCSLVGLTSAAIRASCAVIRTFCERIVSGEVLMTSVVSSAIGKSGLEFTSARHLVVVGSIVGSSAWEVGQARWWGPSHEQNGRSITTTTN